ncbi:MAG: hypothetical protein IJ279_03355 [Clostridia bacterium]|nr:hypothetical protein [Clostridia bacterium]
MLSRILSFFFMLTLHITSYFGLPFDSYEQKKLFNDADFINGFTVMSQQTENGAGVPSGDFTYNESEATPAWMIAQWNSGNCLWENRIDSDKYTITDGLTKTVTYNPEDKSVSMRLNASNVYNGESATYENWPHLLLEQSPICDYQLLSDEDKAFYNCSADRIVLNLDIRLKDFVDTTNKEGVNATQFLAYFYLKGTESHDFIWFGVNLFDDRGPADTTWALDKGSGQMIYCLSSKDTYGSDRKSLFRNGKPYVSDEWTHVEVDLTPHIEKAMKAANKSDTFSREVKKEDFYIGGTNIGFEIHGNYDCTVDIKNFNLTSYNKK